MHAFLQEVARSIVVILRAYQQQLRIHTHPNLFRELHFAPLFLSNLMVPVFSMGEESWESCEETKVV
jgi:hypothetical protein